MKNRPIQLVLIALAQLFNPLFNIVLNTLYFHSHLSTVIHGAWFNAGWADRFGFFFLGPVLAGAIYLIKPWSLPIALFCIGLDIRANLLAHFNNPHQVSLWASGLICLFELILISYLLLPQVRGAYLNRKMRWWESKPRFWISPKVSAAFAGTSFEAAVLNISEGGLFLLTRQALAPSALVTLQLSELDQGKGLTIEARVVYEANLPEGHGFGLQFLLTAQSKKALKEYTHSLRHKGVPSTSEPRHLLTETKEFVRHLLKGEGLVPTPSPRTPRQRQEKVEPGKMHAA